MNSFDELFAAVKDYCKERLAQATYNLFIDGIAPVSFEDNIVTLTIRSEFLKGIVETRYVDLLRDAFKELLGFEVGIALVVPQTEKAVAPVAAHGTYDFTFENFIVGSTNKFAHAAAQAVAANPSGAYNPLFIWGDSGLGKTHLLSAIQFEIQRNHPDYNIVYVDGEKFTNEIITAIHDGTTAEFHNKYRAADVLLVDDIQFIGGKESFRQQAAAVGGIIQRPFQQRMGGIAPCHLWHDREHPGERVHLFRLDGITLEGHGRGANLPSAKRFAQFPDGRRL